jgi:hypothetical protein
MPRIWIFGSGQYICFKLFVLLLALDVTCGERGKAGKSRVDDRSDLLRSTTGFTADEHSVGNASLSGALTLHRLEMLCF